MYAIPRISALFPQENLPAVYAEERVKARVYRLQICLTISMILIELFMKLAQITNHFILASDSQFRLDSSSPFYLESRTILLWRGYLSDLERTGTVK
jgi:hypothetical protein